MPQALVCLPQIVVSCRKVRDHSYGLFQMQHCLAVLFLTQIYKPQVIMGILGVHVELIFQSLVVILNGFLILATAKINKAKVVVCV